MRCCAAVVVFFVSLGIASAQGTVQVSGHVVHSVLNTGLGGVTLNGVPGPGPVQTLGDGAFSFSAPSGWSGTLTPSRPGFTFGPASIAYSNLTQNQSNVLFLASSTYAPTHFYVDGVTGNDAWDGLTPATAWATLTHAMATLMIAGTGHTLHVAGNQVYGPGETFPLDLPPGITLLGEGAVRPRLQVPSTATGLRSVSSPNGVLSRSDEIRNFVFRGGAIAIEAVMNAFAHGIAVDGCRFENLGTAISCHNAGNSTPSVPFIPFVRVQDSEFDGVDRGVDALINAYNWHWTLAVERCLFKDANDVGVASHVGWIDVANRPQVVDCLFQDVTTGVSISGGNSFYASYATPRIANCRFSRASTAGIRVFAGADSLNSFLVERCGFTDCARGADFTLSGSPTAGGYHVHAFRDNFFSRCSTGCAIAFQPGWTDTLLFDRNRYEECVVGLHIQSTQVVRIASSGEVYLDNDTGLVLSGTGGGTYGSTIWNFVLRDGILARNTLAGCQLNATGSIIECTGLTVADNGAFGMLVGNIDPTSTISHCIFDNAGPAYATASALTVDHCCFRSQSVPGVGNLNANPQLFRPYYKLPPGSPCVDAGDPVAVLAATDYEGDPRVIGAAPDIGADEYSPAGTAATYGLAGLGAGGQSPEIAVSAASVPLGAPLTIDIIGGGPQVSLLMVGIDEGSSSFPRELESYGAPGSFVWIEPLLVHAVASQSAQFHVPNAAWLTGWGLTFQWIALWPGANAAGVVTTQGLRVTIGS